jgi:flavin reductase (DIM6/NTAB) family NADH-FMN oxidoreductase RutF
MPRNTCPAGLILHSFLDWATGSGGRHVYTHYHRPHRLNITTPSQPRQLHTKRQSSPLNTTKDASEQLRLAMRAVPNPIAVITASTATTSTPDFEDCYAATLSSFTTVTLSPNPIISFNLRRPSRTLDAILAAGAFRVHILRANTWGKDIAKSVLERRHSAALQYLAGSYEKSIITQVANAQMERKQGVHAPLIRGQAVLADLECVVDQKAEVGDHAVIFAQVLKTTQNEELQRISGDGKDFVPEECALVYHDGDYASVGTRINDSTLIIPKTPYKRNAT